MSEIWVWISWCLSLYEEKVLYWRRLCYGQNPTVIKENSNWTLAMSLIGLETEMMASRGHCSDWYWGILARAWGNMEADWKCKLVFYAEVSLIEWEVIMEPGIRKLSCSCLVLFCYFYGQDNQQRFYGILSW